MRGKLFSRMFFSEDCVNRPILLFYERFNFPLALGNEAERDGLHAPSRKSAGYFLPEKWRELIADDPIENSPRLLGINERNVDCSRRL